MKIGLLRQNSIRKPHPRPDMEIESRSAGSSKAVTRKMTEEDWAKYGPLNTTKVRKVDITNMRRNEIDMKHPHLTKEFFEAEFAKGKSGEQIVREQDLPAGSLNYYLKRVGAVNPNSRPWGPIERKKETDNVEEKPANETTTEVAVSKETDSFIQATIERDAQILTKTAPKKSGRTIQIETIGTSESIEKELVALLQYASAIPIKQYKLQVSLVEVDEE